MAREMRGEVEEEEPTAVAQGGRWAAMACRRALYEHSVVQQDAPQPSGRGGRRPSSSTPSSPSLPLHPLARQPRPPCRSVFRAPSLRDPSSRRPSRPPSSLSTSRRPRSLARARSPALRSLPVRGLSCARCGRRGADSVLSVAQDSRRTLCCCTTLATRSMCSCRCAPSPSPLRYSTASSS